MWRVDLVALDDNGIADLIEQKNQLFEELAKSQGHIIEGVGDFLQMLAANDIRMAICSGALLSEIELILDQANLRSFFETIVSAEQVKMGKPDPEGFLLAMERLNNNSNSPVAPADCIVIEDSHWGLEAAKAAGMHTIAVTNSYDAEQLSIAEKIVTDLRDLTIKDLHQLCD